MNTCASFTLLVSCLFNFKMKYPFVICRGWWCGAMVLGKLPVPGQGLIALAVGAGGVFGHFYSHLSFLSSSSLSLGDGPI